MEDYYPDFYPVAPKLFAWHDPDFRAKVKVGDGISFIDALIMYVTQIRDDGLMLGGFVTIIDPENPSKKIRGDSPQPSWFLKWDELIDRQCIIVPEKKLMKELEEKDEGV